MHPARTDLDSQSLKLLWKRIKKKKKIQREVGVLTLARHHLLKQLVSTTRQVSRWPWAQSRTHVSARRENCGWRQRTSPPSSPWQAWFVWPAGVPSERPQLTALSSQATRRASHCVQTASNWFWISSSLPRSQKPINYTCTCSPFKGWILPSALMAESSISIQAQMEDKGVGLIDQAAPAPMQGLA